MAWRSRVERGAAFAAELATARRVRVAAQLLLLAGLLFAVLRLRSVWHDSHARLAHAGWGWLGASLTLGIGAVIASSFVWVAILRRLGLRTQRSWAATYLQGQLGKYVPGSVWQYASRGTLARQRGAPLRVVAKSFPVELSATIFAAGAFALLMLGWWGAVGSAALIAAAPVAGSRASRERLMLRAACATVPLFAATWTLVIVGVWMTARGVAGASVGDLPFLGGAFVVAWIVGVVAIYAPGGIGVREVVLVTLLRSRIGLDDAVLVAVATRAVFVLADLCAAGISLTVARRPRHAAAEPAAGA
jgi:hypothetical protein